MLACDTAALLAKRCLGLWTCKLLKGCGDLGSRCATLTRHGGLVLLARGESPHA
jgi:hypothetical protein